MTQAQATAIRHARHARVRMIRRRVVAGMVALFVATWLLITVILVTGHDPALAHQKSAATATGSSSSGSQSSVTSSSSTSSGATSTDTGGQSSGGSGSVTPGQSSAGASSVSSGQS